MDLIDDINILPGPGNETNITLWLNNTGNSDEIYYVSASLTDDEWVSIMNVEYLFSLSLEHMDSLVEGRVKTGLKIAFGENGVEIESDAKLSNINGVWVLIDDPNEYWIEVTDSALEISNMNRKAIASYSRERVSLRLHAPSDSLVDDSCTVTIKMTHNKDEVTVSFNITVLQTYGVSIIPDHTESIGRPHLPVVYNFEIMNRGNGMDNISLRLSGKKAGWNITYGPRYFVLAAGTSASASIVIFTHYMASPPDEFVFSFIVTSSSGEKAETVPLIVTVEEYDEMAVLLPSANATMKAGEKSASLDIKVENRGSSDDRYAVVTIEKPNGFTTTVTNYPAADIPIEAYSVKFLIFKITMTGMKEAGTYTFKVGVQSKNNASQLPTFTLNVTVEPVISIERTIDSDTKKVRPGRKVTFYLNIENTGNTMVTVSLVQKNVTSEFTISILPEESLLLGMGKDETIEVEVTALSGISPGVRTLDFIIALGEDGEEIPLEITVDVRGDSIKKEPPVETNDSPNKLKIVLGIVGLLVVLALAAGMIFLLRRKKGPDPVPEEEKSPESLILQGPREEELGDTVEVYSDFTVEPLDDEESIAPPKNRISTPLLPQGLQVSSPVIIRKTLPMPKKVRIVKRIDSDK